MKNIVTGLVMLFVSMQAASVHGQSSKYPPLSEYMMTPEAEVALARSAAPENGDGGVRVHVLCGPGSWAWSWPLASSHDGVHPVLRELDAGREPTGSASHCGR